jgi:hypothetical protein
MDLAEFERDWEVRESEIRHIEWRRQYRDLVLRIHGAISKHLPPDPQDPGGFRRAVNLELTFVSCARVWFDRDPSYANSGIEEWGSGGWTLISMFEDDVRWPIGQDLDEKWFRFYAIESPDWGYRTWIRVVCRDLTYKLLGPKTDMQMPLRP